MNKSKMPSRRKVLMFIGFVIAIVFIIVMVNKVYSFVGGQSTASNSGNHLFKYKPVIVVSGSMEPAIMTNSISILEYCTIDDLQKNDVVMYNFNGIKITHRVIDIQTDSNNIKYLRTKGDANKEADPINITPNMVEGKLIKVNNDIAPYISKFMIAPGEVNPVAVSQAVLWIIVTIAVVGTIVYKIGQFIMILCIAAKNRNNFGQYIEQYKELIDRQTELQKDVEDLNNVVNRGIISVLIKAKTIKEIKTLEEAVDDYEKGNNLVRWIKKVFKIHSN